MHRSRKLRAATFLASLNQRRWKASFWRNPASAEWAVKLEQPILISCREVRQELSSYIDHDVSPELRARIQEHVLSCPGCLAVYDGVRNVLKLMGATEAIELPLRFSLRLYRRLAARLYALGF